MIPSTGLNWDTVNAAAQAMTLASNRGYLATIASGTEQDFITTHLNLSAVPGTYFYLGGLLTTGGTIFQWANGEAPTYFNWANGEPNNFGGNEDVLTLLKSTGQWNDLARSTALNGYLIEINTPSYTATYGNPVSFNGHRWFDPKATSSTYTWNFGDGTTLHRIIDQFSRRRVRRAGQLHVHPCRDEHSNPHRRGQPAECPLHNHVGDD